MDDARVAGRRRAAHAPAHPAAVSPGEDSVEAADRDDIAASLGGDGSAFARLVERHQQSVARLMQRFARDRATHESLVQDTFVEAWQSLSSFRGDAPFLHWLRVLGTRVGYRHWRLAARQRPMQGAPPEVLDALPAAEDGRPAAHEAAEIVHALLARVSPRDRLVLTLLHLEGLSVQQIAELTGWSRVMVKVQAHRARRRLAALLPAGAAPDPARRSA
jgi:RNA polymerase sigma-70 factor, ECF subfamily